MTRSAAQARKSLRGAVFMQYQERFFLWAARPSAAPLHRVSANSSVTFMLSPVRGMVTGGELCWPPPGHTTICCNFGEPDAYGKMEAANMIASKINLGELPEKKKSPKRKIA